MESHFYGFTSFPQFVSFGMGLIFEGQFFPSNAFILSLQCAAYSRCLFGLSFLSNMHHWVLFNDRAANDLAPLPSIIKGVSLILGFWASDLLPRSSWLLFL